MRKKWLIFIAKNNIFSSNDELKNKSCTADQEFTWISVHQKMQKIISSVHPSRSAYNLNHSLKYSTVIVSFKPSSNARVSIHGRLKLPHYCYLETLPWKNCEQDSPPSKPTKSPTLHSHHHSLNISCSILSLSFT